MTAALVCDDVREALSSLADGEGAGDLDEGHVADHVAGCASCRAFGESVARVRQLLRFEAVEDVPDLAPAVRASVERAGAGRRRPGWMAATAAAAVGAVAGSTYVGLDRDPATVDAADIPALVVDAQRSIDALSARLTVTEGGGRTFTGTLAFDAPESLAVVIAGDGAPLITVVDEDRWWVQGPRRCSPPTGRACGPPVRRVVERREPFAEASPVPLDLVAPVDALALAAPPHPLGTRELDGRRAVGIAVPASQLGPMLAGLDPLGSLRPVHPTDPAELWLDADHLVPVAVTIRAGDRAERQRWAAAAGYRDQPGDLLLDLRVEDLEVNGDVPASAFPPPPAMADRVVDGGFEPGDPAIAPQPAALPAGFRPHRSGTVGTESTVSVRSWSDGRAWLVVRATEDWAGGRLFGRLGPFVRAIDLGSAGTGYVDGGGRRVAIHGDGIDVVVTGSLSTAELRRVASSLGVHGSRIPDDWAEATVATLAEAEAAVPGLLVPVGLAGYAPPTARIDGDVVTLVFTGPGDRMFQLIRTSSTVLPPPIEADVLGVRIRGVDGRYGPSSGDLEWVEQGVAHLLRSSSVGLPELVAIAESLEPRP